MKRWTFVAVMAAFALVAPAILAADSEDEKNSDGPTWKWFGSLRMRPEYNDNMSDITVARDDRIFFTSYRANLGFSVGLDKGITLLFDGQATGDWGEDQTPFRGTQTQDTTTRKFNFYRAYAEAKDIFGHPFSLRVGRQPMVFGDEWLLGDADFYGGTSWDGVRGDFHAESWRGDVSLFWMKAGEADTPESIAQAEDQSADFDLYGVWYDGKLTERQALDVGIVYWFDHRRDAPAAEPFQDKRFTYTARYHWGGDERLFINANAAYQTGETLKPAGPNWANIKANGEELTVGYTWIRKDNPNKLWLRAAHYSGDDASTEKDNEAFNILAMDFHERYGFMDFWTGFFGTQFHSAYLGGLSGFEALQLGFDVRLSSAIRIKGIAETMRRDEDPSSTFHLVNLGQEYGVSAAYDYGKNVSLDLTLAQMFPGTAFKAEGPFFGQSSVRRAYLNTVVRF